jgi:hypothetical protein
LRTLLGAWAAMNLGAHRRQAGTRCHTLITERLRATLDVVNAHCTPIHRLPRAWHLSAASINASIKEGGVDCSAIAVPTSNRQRRAHCRRRNQTGCGGEYQFLGCAKTGERHVDTAKRPTGSSVSRK